MLPFHSALKLEKIVQLQMWIQLPQSVQCDIPKLHFCFSSDFTALCICSHTLEEDPRLFEIKYQLDVCRVCKIFQGKVAGMKDCTSFVLKIEFMGEIIAAFLLPVFNFQNQTYSTFHFNYFTLKIFTHTLDVCISQNF